MKHALIVGAGVQGLMTALYLRDLQWQVTVLEKTDASWGCSYVNTGMIVPSHIVPLASPGVIRTGLRLSVTPRSAFSFAPRPTREWLSWVTLFNRFARASHVQRSAGALLALHQASKRLYLDDLAKRLGLTIFTTGAMMLYRTSAGERVEREAGEEAARVGLDHRVLGPKDAEELNPGVRFDVRGGVFYPSDANQDPVLLMEALKRAVAERGVTVVCNAVVDGFDRSGGRVHAARAGGKRYDGDEFVLAAGASSGRLATLLGARLPMLAGKGYSIDMPNRHGMRTTAILSEARVAVSPMGDHIRFGGTMVVAPPTEATSRKTHGGKVAGIAAAISRYLPDYRVERPLPPFWSGLRPLSADGLPYIGRMKRFDNLSVCCGHAMMGLSLAAASGKATADVVAGGDSDIDLSAFDPDRFQPAGDK